MEDFIEFPKETPDQRVHRLEDKIRKLEIEKEALHAKLDAEKKEFLYTIHNQGQEIECLIQSEMGLEKANKRLEARLKMLLIDSISQESEHHGLD